ncbi:PAS domain S-box protein [Catenovulum adriaticum]|uniref:histidine kinase n=1 Tax=Catenovulum adriaticum TaxID=2984846 RepID=A0ABY7AR98_9ALTE|nr:PAS domain S-box protein [Catenovulum sp. TS8]WAJ72059.1 PAS domain S-box protein [Catenovulum sp. TS8]
MQIPPIPDNEIQRLDALYSTQLLDSLPEERFDRITRLVQQCFDVPIALISLVDMDRQWFKSKQGLNACETPREISFCGHAIAQQDIFEIPNALTDERFSDNPLVTNAPAIRFYAGIPLIVNQESIGTLCIIDDKPKKLTSQQKSQLYDFAHCITEEINARNALKLSQELIEHRGRLNNILQAIPDCILAIDRAGFILDSNESFNQRFEIQNTTGQHISLVIPLEISNQIIDLAEQVLKNKPVQPINWQYTNKQHSHYDLELQVNQITASEILLIMRDVTDFVQSQQSLTVQKQRLQDIISGTKVGTWEWNVKTSQIIVNELWVEQLGYQLNELEPITFETCRKLIHPDDFANVEFLLNQCFNRQREFYDCEIRMQHKKGHWVWLHDRGKVVSWNHDNTAKLMSGTHTDISENKQNLHELEQSNAWRRAIVDSAHSSIISTDISGIIKSFSKGAENMLGYTQDEIINKQTPAILHDFDEIVSRSQDLTKELGYPIKAGFDTFVAKARLGAVDENEWTYISKEGRRIPVYLSVTQVLNRDGKATGYLGIARDISQQKQTQQALLESETRLRSLFELSPIGIALNDFKTGQFLDVNQSLLTSAGYKKADFFKLSYWDITPVEYKDDEERLLLQLAQTGQYGPYEKEYINQSGKRYPVLLKGILIKDSSGRELIWSMVEDISERKQQQEVTKNLTSRLTIATDAANVGIWELDLIKNELVWDSTMHQLYEIDPTQFSATFDTWQQALHPDDRSDSILNVDKAIKGLQKFDTLFRIICPGNNIKWIKAAADVQYNKQGEAIRLIGTNWDVTERILNEKKLLKAKDDAEVAAKAKSEFLANMSHEIRTPMNGVLGMLDIVLKSHTLKPQQQQQIEIAHYSATSLLGIINDILDFSKIEAGKLDLEQTEFSLLDIFSQVTESMVNMASKKSLNLVLDVSQMPADVVIGDPARLKQILYNLIGNAIKFTDKGEVRISTTITKPSLQQYPNSNNTTYVLSCAITDTGIGIPTDKLNLLFEAFTQADSSTTRHYGGTGLGLTIVQKLCKLMNGHIQVNSRVDQGSTFEFSVLLEDAGKTYPTPWTGIKTAIISNNQSFATTLNNQLIKFGAETSLLKLTEIEPNSALQYDYLFIDQHQLKQLSASIIDTAKHKTEMVICLTELSEPNNLKNVSQFTEFAKLTAPITPNQLLQLRPQKSLLDKELSAKKVQNTQLKGNVLLAEDNEINQLVVQEILSKLGLQSVSVVNGNHVIEQLKSIHSAKFDLILMDCQMPELDGYQATMAIRQGEAGKHYQKIPIVALTAHAMKGDREKCIAAGMNEYITKPIEKTDLIEKLSYFLSDSV